jgi:hypothetical protein
MIRIACYSAYGLTLAFGVFIMLAGNSLGLPFVEVPFWRLLGVALAGFAIWRLLIAVFGVSTEPSNEVTRVDRKLIMKGPRVQSDRRTGPARILIIR